MSRSESPRSLREEQAAAVRDRLLDAAMRTIEQGEMPTMRGVAKAAGVSERTIYRYFPSFGEMVEALQPRFSDRAGVPLCDRADGLEDYAARLFATFEANAALVTSLVRAPWAAPYLSSMRRANLAQLTHLLATAHPHADSDAVNAAAASLRVVLSGQGWVYLHEATGLSALELGAQAAWTIRALRAGLDASGASRSS